MGVIRGIMKSGVWCVECGFFEEAEWKPDNRTCAGCGHDTTHHITADVIGYMHKDEDA